MAIGQRTSGASYIGYKVSGPLMRAGEGESVKPPVQQVLAAQESSRRFSVKNDGSISKLACIKNGFDRYFVAP